MKKGTLFKLLIPMFAIFISLSCKKVKNNVETIKISREGGTPIATYAFGNSYFNWVDYNKDGKAAIQGTEEPVKQLRLNVIAGGNNQSDINSPDLFNYEQMDKYIQYCRAVGAEPMMIVPVYANNTDRGPTTARVAADIVAYINGTKKYGVKYWSVGWECDIYDIFFKTNKGHRVSNVNEYIEIWNSYAKAMIAANDSVKSGVQLTFIGPELGARYREEDDWLSPMLDSCKNYIDIVGLHVYGFSANELTEKRILNDVDRYREFIRDEKQRISKHGKPDTPLAITSANICYDWDPKLYTEETRRLGPGTFYAAIWNADRMGASLEENLWSHIFWDLAENAASATEGSVFGFLLTDPSKNPPTWELTPEYYVQQMVTTNFIGTTIKPEGVPKNMSVYASYNIEKASTSILVLNKDTTARWLELKVDNLKSPRISFSPMSINLVTIPDDTEKDFGVLEYTMKMAKEGLPPKATH
jgi:hypothetical protein